MVEELSNTQKLLFIRKKRVLRKKKTKPQVQKDSEQKEDEKEKAEMEDEGEKEEKEERKEGDEEEEQGEKGKRKMKKLTRVIPTAAKNLEILKRKQMKKKRKWILILPMERGKAKRWSKEKKARKRKTTNRLKGEFRDLVCLISTVICCITVILILYQIT